VVILLGWLFGASHVPNFNEVGRVLFLAVSPALLAAGLLWLLYIALEPYVRRRWPNTIITWSRVLSGSLRDPLVSRDVLIGILFGIGAMLLYQLDCLVRIWRGAAPLWEDDDLDAWLGARYLIADGVFLQLNGALLVVLLLFFWIFLLRIITRRQWLCAVVFVSVPMVVSLLVSSNPIIAVLFSFLEGMLFVILCFRWGLVAATTSHFAFWLLRSVPITTDFSAWYSASSVIVLLAVLGLAALAFHTSLGGQKLFEGKLLKE
jgi:serine/threonine-protein kinase